MRSVAGYPGLPTELPVDVVDVFLTAATSSEPTAELTEAIRTIRERVTAGSTVLTTASSLTGVHLAWLLARLDEDGELGMPVTLVGRTAKLWEGFGYDEPSIETVSTFADPNAVLDAGQVTFAGPEVPVAGSAEALFDHVADDPGATLVQVTSGAFDPETGDRSRGTVYDFQVSAHPTEETIDEVVEALDPVHVVISHQQGKSADQYKDKYDSFVWACEDADEYTLYDDEWVGPAVGHRSDSTTRSGPSVHEWWTDTRGVARYERGPAPHGRQACRCNFRRRGHRRGSPRRWQ